MSLKLALAAFSFLLFSACGEKDNKEMQYGKLKVQFNNDTSLRATGTPGYPDKLELIILSIRILETDGNDGSIGRSSFIYINPDCALTEDELTEAQEEAGEGATIPDSDIDGCAHETGDWTSGGKTIEVTKQATTAVDLALGSEAVNETLNAQQRGVETGDAKDGETATTTYRQLGISFRIQEHETTPNIVWSFADNDVENQGFVWARNETSLIFDEPLDVSTDERVLVILNYDLEGAVRFGVDADYNDRGVDNRGDVDDLADNCVGTAGAADRTCLVIPDLNPTVERLN